MLAGIKGETQKTIENRLNSMSVTLRQPVYSVDAVPFFPFRVVEKVDRWVTTNPLGDCEQELNESAYRLVTLCDGYRTWYEVVYELAKLHRQSFVEIRKVAELFIERMTDQGMIWWRNQRMHWQQTPPPIAVLWDLTSRCNLNCQHCVVDANLNNRLQLSLDDCIRLIDEMVEFGVQQLILSGGEPMIRRDFFDIVKHAVDKGLIIQVATNATLISKQKAQKLARLGGSAQVSLDALTPALHDQFRGCKDTWQKAVGGINRLVRAGVTVSVASVVTRLNIDEIPDLYRYVYNLGVDSFRIMPFVPYGRGRQTNSLEVEPGKMKKLATELKQIQREIGLSLAPIEFECTLRRPNRDLPAQPGQHIGCDGALAYCTITATGEVLPCNYFAGVEAENVMTKSFQWIWQNSRILNYFRSLQTDDLHGVCRSCDWLGECRGSCIAANFAHGDIFQSNCHCWRVNPV